MSPHELAPLSLKASREGRAGEWTFPLRPPGWLPGPESRSVLFSQTLRTLLPPEFEIEEDTRTDTFTVRRVYRETVSPYPPLLLRQGELFDNEQATL
jgi:hypothetical protein